LRLFKYDSYLRAVIGGKAEARGPPEHRALTVFSFPNQGISATKRFHEFASALWPACIRKTLSRSKAIVDIGIADW